MERKSYLIRHSFWRYIAAAILSMSAMNLKSIVDGILMGNFLGPNALSAINVVVPMVNCIGAIALLFSQGPAIRMSMMLGARENEKANQVYSVSLMSLLVVSVVLTVVVGAGNLAVPISDLLCVEKTLLPDVEKYASVLLFGCTLLILENGLSTLINVMGDPKIVTIAMTVSMCVNIVFDVLFVKVLNMDIAGAAYATLMGSLSSVVVFVYYLFRRSGMKLCRCPKWLSELGSGLVSSLPGVAGSLAAVALMLICNFYVQAHRGADGMFVMSVGYSMISIGSMFSNAIGMSYAAIGGMLMGQEDSYGLLALFRRGIVIAIVVALVFNVAGLFSREVAMLFGGQTQSELDMAAYGLPLICTLLFALGIISSMVYLHTVLGHGTVATVNSLLVLVCVLISFIVVEKALPDEQLWLAFPIASVLSLLIFFLVTCVARWKSGGKLRWVSLLPKEGQETEKFDVSVRCEMADKSAAIDLLIAYLHDHGAERLEDSVIHCMDELMMNIVTFSGCGKDSYMDLTVSVRDQQVNASLRSCGKPFDPTQVKEEEKKLGMKIVSHYCRQMEYRYTYGQNMVFAAWPGTPDA